MTCLLLSASVIAPIPLSTPSSSSNHPWTYHTITAPVTMSTNRPFLANFLAAFRAQSTYKASSSSTGTSSLSSAQISQSARAIASKAAGSGSSQTHTSQTAQSSSQAPPAHTSSTSTHHSHHYHSESPPTAASPPPTPSSSIPIPITRGPDRQRRGSDSSSGSGGFRDALGPEKWYIGGRTPAGEERFYRLGMVTKGGGRLGGSGRVGSIDQLSL